MLFSLDSSWISTVDANTAAEMMTSCFLEQARNFIPRRCLNERRSTHPWINDRVIRMVKEKIAVEWTDVEVECRKRCSACIMEEYGKHVMRERNQLQDMPKGAKAWWSRSQRLMQKKGVVSAIPAPKNTKNQWVLPATEKANLFADTFSKKHSLNQEEENEYTELPAHQGSIQRKIQKLQEKDAQKVMDKLDINSGTGPDLLPARILRYCSAALARPVLLLTMCILTTGVWPQLWLQHWVAPLYKKKSVYHPGNVSKVVERLLKTLCYPHLKERSAFGARQFAHATGRGARDALAILVLTWVQALATGRKVAVYCSDVSGAFDRVRMKRLTAKLKQKGLHPQIVAVLASWLRRRFARIVVGGAMSNEMSLMNMVFQGTVTGPILRNLFFEDARRAINECFSFTEVVYADDLNAYRVLPSTMPNNVIKKSLDSCQQELHKWGAANQAYFDAGKESQHVLSLSDPFGNSFKLLGVPFDPELSMADAISEIVAAAGWKLKTLLRTRRYYTDSDLIVLCKAHLLSYLEYRTPAIYHATRAVLGRLDAVQTRFLKDIGVDEVTALIEFRLAPLCVHRHIAMLGLIHRTTLGKGPDQFQDFFKRDPQGYGTLRDPRHACKSPLIKRSAFGLVAIYNMLPPSVVEIKSVSAFQKRLQEVIVTYAASGHTQWAEVLSPRLPLTSHPAATLSSVASDKF